MKLALIALLTLVLFGSTAEARHRHHYRHGGAWCGIYMMAATGIHTPGLALARNWARIGRPSGPQVGAIVIWPHHVGRIVGQQNGQWIVNSGNDGGRVRTRPRSISGAIAFRMI